MRRLLPVLAAAVLGSALTAAVIAVGARAKDSEEERPRQRLERFERCMREHGFDLSGPKVEIRVTPDGVTVNGEKVDAEAFRRAERECRPLFPRPRLDLDLAPPPDDLRQRLERMERCLRESTDRA